MLKLNKVMLAGRLVRDPEVRHTANGKVVTSFSVAVDGYNKDAPSEFFGVTAFEKQATFIGDYFKKGMAIFVEGRLNQQTWEKDGQKNSKVVVIATGVSFVENKAANQAASEHAKPQAAHASAPAASAPAATDAPDDLPF